MINAVLSNTGKKRMKAAQKDGHASQTRLPLSDRLTACATRFSVTVLYFVHIVCFVEQAASCPQHRSAVLFPSVGFPPCHGSASPYPPQTAGHRNGQTCSFRAVWRRSVVRHAHAYDCLTRTIKVGKRHDMRRRIKQERRKCSMQNDMEMGENWDLKNRIQRMEQEPGQLSHYFGKADVDSLKIVQLYLQSSAK